MKKNKKDINYATPQKVNRYYKGLLIKFGIQIKK